jgi:acyl-CoA synthetase (AMP-forming)/AMP-acid ligase II
VALQLADLLEAVADAVPDREAVVRVAPGGVEPVRLTYALLDERATRLAHHLAALGVSPGDHVALHLRNGHQYLEAMFAAFKLRAVPVNVNYRYVEHELGHVLVDSGAVGVIHEPDGAPVVEAVAGALPSPPWRLATGAAYETAISGASAARDFAPRSAEDRYVLYTGGTTRLPRGVTWRHEDIFCAALASGAPARTAEDVAAAAGRGRIRCLPASPLVHGSAQWMALATIFRGGTVVVTAAPAFAPDHVWDVVDGEGVSFLVVVGDAFVRPLVDALDHDARRWDLSSLTVVLSGGAVLSPAVRNDLLRLLPGLMVVDGFGASETGGQGQMVATAGAPGAADALRFRVNEETAVLDDDLRPLPPGDGRTGWLARRGHIPLGYRNDADATARTFPVVDGVRWAVPGDRAHVEPDGTVVVHGRGSASINSGGEKVHPEEVEAVLKGHPDVFDAVVVGVPHPRWGEQVCAVVQARPGRRPALGDVVRHCRERLAGFKLPRRLVLVSSVRRTDAGKPDYRWAREVARAKGTGSDAGARAEPAV